MKASVQINQGIESLFGTRDENIRLIESGLGVSTHLLDSFIEIQGEEANVSRAERILEDYAALVREGHVFTNGDLNSYFRVVTEDAEVSLRGLVSSGGSAISLTATAPPRCSSSERSWWLGGTSSARALPTTSRCAVESKRSR